MICPKCGFSNPNDPATCEMCGTVLAPPPIPSVPPPFVPPPFIPSGTMPPAPVPYMPPPFVGPPPKKKIGTWQVVVMVVAGVFVLGGIASCFSSLDTTTSTSSVISSEDTAETTVSQEENVVPTDAIPTDPPATEAPTEPPTTAEPTTSTKALVASLQITQVKAGKDVLGDNEVYVTVKNTGDFEIDSFDVTVMCYNAYGERLKYYTWGDYNYSGTVSKCSIAPGKAYNNATFTLFGYDTATEFYVAITRFHTTAGETVTIPSNDWDYQGVKF